MKEKWQLVWVVMKRELRDQLSDWRILSPIIFLTLAFPPLMNISAHKAVDFVNKYGADLVVERMVSFFVLVVGFFPLTVGLVVALESFVGEKERGTIEPLLSSPLEDWQLYTGKLLSSLVVPLSAAMLDIFIYLLSLWLQHFAMPPWWLQVYAILLTLMEGLAMVSAAMFISTQANSVRGANLLASFIIIPMALLLEVESMVLFFGDHATFWMTMLGLAIFSFLLIRLGLAHFQRELLLSRHNLSLTPRLLLRRFWQKFLNGQHTLADWYRDLGRFLFRRLRTDLIIVTVISLLSAIVAYVWMVQIANPHAGSKQEFIEALKELSFVPNLELTFWSIFGHNLQALLVISFIGLSSFSLMGIVFLMLNFSLIGIVVGGAQVLDYSALELVIRGILPHGIFELPALILAGALTLYVGLMLLTPQTDRTLGEILIEVSANWTRAFLGVVLPLLVIAAAVEVWITPHLLKGFF